MKLTFVSFVFLWLMVAKEDAAASEEASTNNNDNDMRQNTEQRQQLLCLTRSEIAAELVLAAGRNDTKKRLTRVTVPSTASTEFRTRMPIVTGSDEAFPRFASLSSCPDSRKLCFHQTTNTTTTASTDNPFVQLEFISMNDGHHAYDKVLQLAANDEHDENPYLMTTLRDAVDYSVANYKRRAFWDGPFPNIKELQFEEWLRQVPWRANQMTRMIGRSDGDERVLTRIVDPIITEELRANVYMKQQNELGVDSEILQTAWTRLQQMQWFGLFHRLRESMELLAFTFCADTNELLKYYTRPSPPPTDGDNNLDKLTSRIVGGDIGKEEKERLLTEILERNRLDVILLERAEALFNERLDEMRKAKDNGILCRFAGTVDVTCGGDDNDSDGDREEL